MTNKSSEKFVKLAEKRVQNALKCIRLVGNLSNRVNYTYTESDVKQIHTALKKAVEDCRSRFNQDDQDQKDAFKFT